MKFKTQLTKNYAAKLSVKLMCSLKMISELYSVPWHDKKRIGVVELEI